jgi:hypothetical protein
MYLRNHPGYKWGTVEYFPAHFFDAKEPPGFHEKRRGKGDGESP